MSAELASSSSTLDFPQARRTAGRSDSPADLLLSAVGGDERAWQALVDRYTPLLWSVARAHRLASPEAADVVQVTWLRLLEHAGSIREPERLAGWLATTARRECIALLRRSGRESVLPNYDGDSFDIPDENGVPLDAGLLREERDALLWQAFRRLPQRCQTLLRVLVNAPEHSYAEVSNALGMPIGSIGPTRGRCLSRLRELAVACGLADLAGRSPGEG